MKDWNDARFVVPPPRVEVLCALLNGKCRVGYYVDGSMDSNVGFFGIDQYRIRPTHWMHLPEAPVASNK
jgi:hypothetical protein